jgi:hypothetical protein
VDTQILKDMIAVISREQKRRWNLLNGEDPDFYYDQWQFTDRPFLNELCLMVLVTLRHQVERELAGLAARADEGGEEISGQQYHKKVKQLCSSAKKYWKEIKRLKPESCEEYKFIKVLRALSNSYKHDYSMVPDKKLSNLLHLETGVNYAFLPESDAVWEKLANFIGLEKDADYCDIAERFVDIASDFLAKLESRTKLSKVKWDAVSFDPSDFAR